jgi:hypothetical protein
MHMSVGDVPRPPVFGGNIREGSREEAAAFENIIPMNGKGPFPGSSVGATIGV